MHLNSLSPAPGSTKARKRVGRGIGCGWGKTCGTGHKGQKSRSGGSVRPGFEGGQMPLYRKLPRRGFNNAQFTTYYEVVNVSDLAKLGDAVEANPESMAAAGILRPDSKLVKVLGTGDLDKAIKVSAHKFSASAKAKIEKAGGEVIVL